MKKLFKKLTNLLPTSAKYSLYRSLVKIPEVDMNQVVFKLTETREELEGAFAILHDSYVDVGLMKQSPSGLRVTPYHALNSSVTLIGKVGHEIVATLTIITDSKLGLPSDNFIDLSKLRQGGKRIAEISALAIKKKYRGQMLFHLLKYMYEWCTNYLSINHLIATLTTDTKSYELYESILFFKRIENKIEANYAFSNFRPVIAEHLNLDEARELFEKHYSKKKGAKNLYNFFVDQKSANFQFPDRRYFTVNYPVMDAKNFSYFFTEKTTALSDMSEKELLSLSSIFKGMSHSYLIDKALNERNIFAINRFQPKERFEVSIFTTAIVNQQLIKLRILDISENGLKISSHFVLNDKVDISIPSAQGGTYKIVARKMWENEYGVTGLKIISADEKWHSMIQHFNKSHCDMVSGALKQS